MAFFLDNHGVCDVDASHAQDCNPGIGGTEYQFLLIAARLTERLNGIDVRLYVTRAQLLPSVLNVSVVPSLEEAIALCENNDTEYLVLKHVLENVTTPRLTSSRGLKFIVWCHVFACYWELDAYAENRDVTKVIFVGKETMQLYLDHPIMKKSTYIYNAVPFGSCEKSTKKYPFCKREHIVTYMGSLVPFKGFHLLAKAWKDVIKAVPDAQLYVIGSGQVYDSSAHLGEYGIAEAKYEHLLCEYLSNDGRLLPGVHFMGRMGGEKNDILMKTKVGVPNPTGITETFCLCAVEMQCLGARITTIKAPGYLDTVRNGILYSSPSQLATTIIRLLQSEEDNYDDAMRFFRKYFAVEVVVARWEQLLLGQLDERTEISNYSYRLKWLKDAVRRLSKLVPINIVLPPIERLLIFWERNVKKQITYMDSDVLV